MESCLIDPATGRWSRRFVFEVPGVQPEQLQSRLASTSPRTAKCLRVRPSNCVAVIHTATKEVANYILVGQWPWHGQAWGQTEEDHVATATQRFDGDRRRVAEGREVGARGAAALGVAIMRASWRGVLQTRAIPVSGRNDTVRPSSGRRGLDQGLRGQDGAERDGDREQRQLEPAPVSPPGFGG